MSRELKDNELERLSGGRADNIPDEIIKRLGLKVHAPYDCCDSFEVLPREAESFPNERCCYCCLYGGYSHGNIACLLGH